jgi:hypothetical protein
VKVGTVIAILTAKARMREPPLRAAAHRPHRRSALVAANRRGPARDPDASADVKGYGANPAEDQQIAQATNSRRRSPGRRYAPAAPR